MGIHFQQTLNAQHSAEQFFAVLDDFSQTPKWLPRCTGIDKLSPGDNTVGTKLRYHYQEGHRHGCMDGEITARVPNRQLAFRYHDPQLSVAVEFWMLPAVNGAELTHAIEIIPRTFWAKLFTPLIRHQLPKQTQQMLDNLGQLLKSMHSSH